MKKLSLSFFIALASCVGLYAQKDSAFASARYTLTHISDTNWRENPYKENMILLIGKNMSCYANFDRIERKRKSLSAGINSLGTLTAVTVSDMPASASTALPAALMDGIAVGGNYYKDIAGSKIFHMDFRTGKLFSVEEKIPAIDWAITQETKEIMGLACQKATGDCKGRTYEAWFCIQLPFSNGPWKLGGLPGLILEAYDTKREVVFNFVSFENATGAPMPIEIPASASKVTVKEFNQYLAALEKDGNAMAGSSSVTGGVMMVKGFLTGPDGKPARMREQNNPIEKETKKH